MPLLSFRGRAAFLLSLCLVAMAGGWHLCHSSDGIAFLPSHSGAEWIVKAVTPQTMGHSVLTTSVIFNRSFNLESVPNDAELSVCAFRVARLTVNGELVPGLCLNGNHWKFPATSGVTALLRAGTNTITAWVTNTYGPAALWLRLQADAWSLGSDSSWLVLSPGGTAHNARCAATRPVMAEAGSIYDDDHTYASIHRIWPWLALLAAVSMALAVGVRRWLGHCPAGHKHLNALLVFILLARAALFLNNQPELPWQLGFDSTEHGQYIQFIEKNRALPLPGQAWEAQQPPLYYVASELWLRVLGLTLADDRSVQALRILNGMIGLAQCWMVMLCLRRLFPGNWPAQAAGLLVAGFLPPELYLSQYVTNEPLAALFVSAAFYFYLRALQAGPDRIGPHLCLGVALGAALLTKYSALLAVVLFPCVLVFQLLAQRDYRGRSWLRSVGLATLVCLAVCGWYYARNFAHFGRLVVWNWEVEAGAPYWLDPGFHTSGDYLVWGRVLVSPLFSAFHSFGDGVYSTLWGDGLISGQSGPEFRPPWNYDLMGAGYWVSLPVSLLFALGFFGSLGQFLRKPTPEWLALLGVLFLFGLGMVYMSLSLPAYSQAKAFYGLPALVSFCALMAAGWSRLGQLKPGRQTILWSLLIFWALTSYGSFWIRRDNAETQRLAAVTQLERHLYPAALNFATDSLRLNPDDPIAHCVMANILFELNRREEAVQEYETASRLRPNDAGIRASLAALRRIISKDQHPKAH